MTPVRPAIAFQIERWAAWAPSIESQSAWLQWLAKPTPLPDEGMPPLAEMSAMMRRRIEPLGRVALQAAYWAQGDEPTGPVVFASRWGELARSLGMLQALADEDPLSPTAFSMSVHNAIGALYSIARKDKHNYLAVASGESSVEAGFVEATGLLADGAERVLLVYFDAPLPTLYAKFDTLGAEVCFPHAFACLLSRAGEHQSGALSLTSDLAGRSGQEEALPPGLEVLSFLLGTQTGLHRAGWSWARHVD